MERFVFSEKINLIYLNIDVIISWIKYFFLKKSRYLIAETHNVKKYA